MGWGKAETEILLGGETEIHGLNVALGTRKSKSRVCLILASRRQEVPATERRKTWDLLMEGGGLGLPEHQSSLCWKTSGLLQVFVCVCSKG